MVHIITGHRGTGKTNWLKIIGKLYKSQNQNVLCFDLDRVVENLSGKTVHSLFQKGESVFRTWEKKAFAKILFQLPEGKKVFISVGAGFHLKKNPKWQVIHLRRPSDYKGGRLLPTRPRLKSKSASPYKESLFYHSVREPLYKKQADEIFTRKEHFQDIHISDKLFLGLDKFKKPFFSMTLHPHLLPKKENHLKSFLKKRQNWGIRFFELNDQTATPRLINQIRDFLPNEKLLFSSQKTRAFASVKNKRHWCWDLGLGPPKKDITVLSLHDRKGKDLKSLIKDFSKYKGVHLKLAPIIYNLQELWEGFCWQKEDWRNRSFLPRSLNGQWKWYRLAFGPQIKLYFIKEEESPIKDQPFFSEAVHWTGKAKKLAGVIGDPVELSATPSEHNDFFTLKRNIPVFPVLLKKEEMTKENLNILKNFGFVFFAVTSPLKQKAFDILFNNQESSKMSNSLKKKSLHSRSFNELKKLESLNTLILHKGKWKSYNTDKEGFSVLKTQVAKNKKVAIWGGGGIRPPLIKLFPEASFYSARRGKPVYGKEMENPEILIWGVGRTSMKQGCRFPPKKWKPSIVLDINYTEDSPGLEYAMSKGTKYKSGWDIFKRQAAKQRRLFELTFK